MDISYYKKYEPIFGSWKIVREIGEGSFGKVFEIERTDFGYTYKAALKVITVPQGESELDSILAAGMDMGSATEYCHGIVKELNEEFRLMSKLKGNSNVVSYEDHVVVEHTDGIGWDILIRMELLTPLMKYIRSNPLNRDGIIQMGIDICKALELCRKHDIVHRDIKPDNIFVSDDGLFKLGDFGIAKTMEHTTGSIGKKGTYNEISFCGASASSQIYCDGILYSASNVIDGREDTSWQEDASDDGEGEYVELLFDDEIEIGYLAILPGYAANNDFYYSNNRPKDILIEFSDGRSCTYTLPDSNSYITLELSDTVSTTYVRITILSVYAGTKWDDTAISEVIAYR